ncbi:MAG: hypothetical protein R3E58_09905 [Phycisphaerae bacterium]
MTGGPLEGVEGQVVKQLGKRLAVNVDILGQSVLAEVARRCSKPSISLAMDKYERHAATSAAASPRNRNQLS